MDTKDFAAGEGVGRYILEERLGSGGMGVLFRAHDPELDRRVAIKFVRPTLATSPKAHERMLREAKALAALTHPHVVSIFDVGTHQGAIFLVMEYVRGRSLRHWLEERRRSWAKIVSVFVAAGRGLAAVHEAGLVHRDFKPDNVLVGDDGRVLLADFGLALEEEAPTLAPVDEERSGTSTPRGTTWALGTPGYIAPEQYLGEPAGAWTDQFSFCAALYEALTGHGPFPGSTPDEIREATLAGRVAPVVRGRAPRTVHGLLARGLERSPRERYGSMGVLLEGLLRSTVRARRLRWAAVAAALAGALAAVLIPLWPRGRPPCGDDGSLQGIWGQGRRKVVRAAFLRTGKSYAADGWRFVDAALGAYAKDWAAARRRACEEGLVHRRRLPRDLAGTLRCLDGRRAELEGLIRTFAEADAAIVRRAPLAARRLSSIQGCGSRRGGRPQVPVPADPALRQKVAALRRRLARVRALTLAGRFKEAKRAVLPILRSAERVGYRPLLAEAWYRRGFAERRLAKAKEAEASLRKAANLASSVHYDRLATRAWGILVHVVGVQLARRRDGERAAQQARAGLERLGADSLTRAQVLIELAGLADRFGKNKQATRDATEALALFQKVLPSPHPTIANALNDLAVEYAKAGKLGRALALFERAHQQWKRLVGPNHPALVRSLGNLGNIWILRGKLDRAERYIRRALAVARRALPKDHPALTNPLNNLGVTLKRAHRYREALPLFREALAIRKRSLGPTHPQTVAAMSNCAAVLIELGRLEEARKLLAQTAAVEEKRLGPGHPQLAVSLTNLGNCLVKMGRFAEARANLQRALRIKTRALGPGHASLGLTLHTIGYSLEGEGRFAEARTFHRRALAITRKALGGGHRRVAESLARIARTWLREGKPAKALPLFARALAIYRKGKVTGPALEEARFGLARAQWHFPSARPRALAGARRALAGLHSPSKLRRKIRRWLAGRR